MTIKTQVKSLLLAGLIAAAATPGRATPIDVRFLPPDIEIPKSAVCAPRIRDEDMIADWSKWDRKSLAKRDIYATMRDMNRLRDIDAKRFEPILSRMQELLPTIKSNYTETDALFDKVKLMLALGQSDEVRKQGLVQNLLVSKDHSAGSLNTLSNYLIEGRGIDADRTAGLNLKIKAAYDGNAEAILDLAKLNKNGEKIENWDIEPELAVNMAFGSLVGVLDQGICDRIGRVAREYDGGEIVKSDPAISVAWYRFAADLGDSYSAWKVSEYNLLSEKVPKDNAVLVKYITLAAAGGNIAAILELGKMYEEGSLVERDRNSAMHYYTVAAKAGSQAGLVRLAQLLEKTKDSSPQDSSAYEAILRELTTRDNPPAWAFTRLARIIQARDGIWQSEQQVRPLLEKAVENGDAEGEIDLADLLVQNEPSPAAIASSTDLLTHAIQNSGNINALAKLQRVYLCIAPNGPNVAAASFWSKVEDGAGNRTIELKPEQIEALPTLKDPMIIAAIQTRALYGRPSAIAMYQRYLSTAGYSNQVLKFWEERAEVQRGAVVEAVLLDFKQNIEKGRLAEAKQSIRLTSEAMSIDAGINFTRFLVENYASDKDSVQLAEEILLPLAKEGYGQAVKLLEELEGGQTKETLPARKRYAERMRQNGDMFAQLILAEDAADEPSRHFFYQRAIGSQRCSYDDIMSLAEFAMRFYPSDTMRWLATAKYLAGDDAGRQVKIGDMYLSLGTPQSVQMALKLYEKARQVGETTAFYRLVKYYAFTGSGAYDPKIASDIFVDMIQHSDVASVPAKLLMLDKMKPEIRRQVGLQINVRGIYERSAKAGQPVAMRELAKLMRSDPKEKGSAARAFAWLKQAAETGESESMYLLSQSYAFGIGTKPSLEEAQLWMRKAAEAGYPEAAHMLMLTKAGTEG